MFLPMDLGGGRGRGLKRCANSGSWIARSSPDRRVRPTNSTPTTSRDVLERIPRCDCLTGQAWTNNVVLGEESIQREYGTFTCNDTKLSFVVDVPDFEASGWAPLHIVRWGSRVYLINEERLADFEDAIQRGFEPRTTRHGLFYLREGDQTKPVSGAPYLA